MPLIRAVVNFEHVSGLPENVMQNVLHFGQTVGPVEAADLAAIGAAIDRFYNVTPAGGFNKPSSYMTQRTVKATPKPVVTYYEVDAVTGLSGSPIGASDLLTFAPPAASFPLPEEVAVCLSFHGTLTDIPESVPFPPAGPAGDTRPASRHRGRIYLPGLSTDALATSGQARPELGLQNALKNGAAALRDDAALVAQGIEWVVYSRTNHAAYPVVGGWVDNAFDTQRRRGADASSRVTF